MTILTICCSFLCTDVCCQDTFVDGLSEVCEKQSKEGEVCPSTRDIECVGDLGCGLDERDGKYVCCNKVGEYRN